MFDYTSETTKAKPAQEAEAAELDAQMWDLATCIWR